MMWEAATKEQLMQIATAEHCPLSFKYEALRELQNRYIPEEIRADILYRLGTGTPINQVATENGLSVLQVQDFIRSQHQKHKTEENWKIGYKQTLKSAGRTIYERGA